MMFSKNLHIRALVACCLLFTSVALVSAKVAKVPFMALEEAKQSMEFSVLGSATFSVLWFDIYDSTLMTTSGQFPIEECSDSLIFEIRYLRDIATDELIARTIEQWEIVGINSDEYKGYLPQLEAIWPDIEKGDKLALFIDKNQSYFYFNQQYIGSISSPSFGMTFLDIWLSRKTSEPELRAKLLGQTDEK